MIIMKNALAKLIFIFAQSVIYQSSHGHHEVSLLPALGLFVEIGINIRYIIMELERNTCSPERETASTVYRIL